MATTTAKKTAKKTARKKTTTAKRTSTTRTPKAAAPLTARAPKIVLEDAGYAAAGFARDVVELARTLPTRLEKLRNTDTDALVAQLTTLLDSKAADGRKVTADVRKDARVQRLLEQTGNTRSQVKAAVTSLRRSGATVADVAAETIED